MKFASTVFITLEMVTEIHREQVAEHGGREGIRDLNLVESALEMPKQGTADGVEFYPTLFDKASVYAFHLAQGQAFVDGNKRVALVAALTFLAINGYAITEERPELYDAMIAIANKTLKREDLAELFRDFAIDSMTR